MAHANVKKEFYKLTNCNDPTLETRLSQKKSTSSPKSREKKMIRSKPKSSLPQTSSCKTCYTPHLQTTLTIKKLPAINSESRCSLFFECPVVHQIQVTWKPCSTNNTPTAHFLAVVVIPPSEMTHLVRFKLDDGTGAKKPPTGSSAPVEK